MTERAIVTQTISGDVRAIKQVAALETIAAAAIRIPDGKVISVDPPLRHHDCFRAAREQGIMFGEMRPEEQGFVTSFGRFVGRKEACEIARTAGQIVEKHGPNDTLFSEDMW